MIILLRVLAAALLLLGGVLATMNANFVLAFRAGDYGGAMAVAALWLVPFVLAAKWAWNKSLGRPTSWALIVILVLWTVGGLVRLGQGQAG